MANHTPLEADTPAPLDSRLDSPDRLTAGHPEISQLLDERPVAKEPTIGESDVDELDFSVDDIFGDVVDVKKEAVEDPATEVVPEIDQDLDQVRELDSVNGSFKLETDPDGTITESHSGDGPNYTFELKERPGGDLKLIEADGAELSFSDNPELSKGRTELLEKATLAMEDPAELARFKADMIRFENRDDLSPEEMQATYAEVGRLFDENPDSKIDGDGRTTLAGQVMRLAANPTSVDQGKHNTCTVASVEARLYTRNPSLAAKLVADVAHDGTFTTSRGKEVEIPEGNFRPDEEASKEPTVDGERSFASQIFQTSMVNAVHQELEPGLLFEQVDPEGPSDLGERLYRLSEGEQFFRQNAPDMNDDRKALAYELITGEDVSAVALDQSYEVVDQDTGQFKTEEQFRDYLSKLKEEGQLPAMLSVVPGSGPFATEGYQSFFGEHAVLVTDFDEATDEVRVDNQWGSERDRIDEPMTLSDLYAATLPVELGWEHRLGGKIDAEFPDISENERRARMLSGRIDESSPAELHGLGASLGSIMEISDREFFEGELGAEDYVTMLTLHQEIFDKLPPDQQLRALERRQNFMRDTPSPVPGIYEQFAEKGFESAVTTSGLMRSDVEGELKSVLDGDEIDEKFASDRDMRRTLDFLQALPEEDRERFIALIPQH